MGAISGGKGGDNHTSSSRELEAFTGELREQSRPVREETFKQILEGLTTGGIGARIPIINQSIEASRAATSNALRQTRDSLAQSGLVGTGTGQRVLAETLMQGEQRTAQLPTELVQQFITTALGQATGTPTTIVQGYGAAADAQSRNQAASQMAFSQLMNSLTQTGAMIGAGAAMCWVAEAIYGKGSIDFLLARQWIMHDWKGPLASTTRLVYRITGPTVAKLVKRSPLVKRLLKPLFDVAVRKAREVE